MKLKFQWIITVFLIMAIFAIYYIFLAEIPIAVVKGQSMLPLLREGDLVIITKVNNPSDIKVGDVVVYRNPVGKLIIHRVIMVWKAGNEYYYITQGDNNMFPDYPKVAYSSIVGKVFNLGNSVFKIPYIGHLLLLLRDA